MLYAISRQNLFKYFVNNKIIVYNLNKIEKNY